MPRGVRLNPEHDEKTRAKIQTSQIINRLEKHINGEAEMSNSQVRAAEILLKKTLPDLSAVGHAIEEVGPGVLSKILHDISGTTAGLPSQDEKIKHDSP